MFERLIPSPSPTEKGAEKRIKCEFVGQESPVWGIRGQIVNSQS